MDLVAYGGATSGEGGTTVNDGAPLEPSQGAARKWDGCQDEDNNRDDFEVVSAAALAPRSSASPHHHCHATRTPTSTATAAPPGLYVNELLPRPVSDWNADGAIDSEDEWIELYNANEFAVDLGGWQLVDASGDAYSVPAGTLVEPRGFRLFFHKETRIALNDDGDEVQLLHLDSERADSLAYSETSPDASFSRNPDGGGAISSLCPPSPGGPNCRLTPTPTVTRTPYSSAVVINEFMPRPEGDWNGDGKVNSLDEWIELYNRSARPVDLSGWQVDDAEGGSSPHTLASGTLLGPHGYLVLYGNRSHIALNDDGDAVRLLHPNGTVADVVEYAEAELALAYGREPDGAANWQTKCAPSPRQANCSIVYTPTPTPVYQFTSLAEARALPPGARITVRGSVVAAPCTIERYGHELVISDGEAGLDIFLPSPERFSCAIEVGEQIVATGIIADAYGMRQLRLESNRAIVRHYDRPQPIAAQVLKTGEMVEDREALLLAVQGRVANGRGSTVIWVDDGSGAIQVQAVASTGVSFDALTVNSVVRVTGIGYHYDRASEPGEGYQLRIRGPEDVEVLELAEKAAVAPGGRGKDLGAVSLGAFRTTRTNNYVLVGGIVTAPRGLLGANDFWIQDTTGGAHVRFAATAGAIPELRLGDSVTVRGRVVNYFGERELSVELPSSVTVYGAGTPVPPRPVSTGGLSLDLEAMLVEITGTVLRTGSRELFVDDGSGEVRVYVAAGTGIDIGSFGVGDRVRVAGLVRRVRARQEIQPRFQSDLTRLSAAQPRGRAAAATATRTHRPTRTVASTPTATTTCTPPLGTIRLARGAPARPAMADTRRGISLGPEALALVAAAPLLFAPLAGMALLALLAANNARRARN